VKRRRHKFWSRREKRGRAYAEMRMPTVLFRFFSGALATALANDAALAAKLTVVRRTTSGGYVVVPIKYGRTPKGLVQL
jgi:hypothetical protein